MSKNNYVWLTPDSQRFLEMDYLLPGQTVDQRVDVMCNHAEELLQEKGFAAKFKTNVQKGWYSFSSPVWSNFGTERGLPISCFGATINDSVKSIMQAHFEAGMMSKYGGGTSGYFGNIRPRGSPIKDNGITAGPCNFMHLFETLITVISQGSTRRGQFAAYLPIDHPDILEFLELRTEGHFIQNMSSGVCVTDAFMNRLIARDSIAMKVWAALLKARASTGYPYIFFVDTANRNTVDVYRDKKMRILHSNLCCEIALPDTAGDSLIEQATGATSDGNPATAGESFVCCLGSTNDRYFDDWKHTDAVALKIKFLDAVMTDFINRADGKAGLERAVLFARRHRALGLGQLGWHDYLQHHMTAFESLQAKAMNVEIARTIQMQASTASQELAKRFGEPEVLKGYGRRNTTLTAIAPTKSSSFILGGTSEGIEPHRANYYIKDLQKGKFTIVNQQLKKNLQGKGMDDEDVWQSILQHGGSVQHLSCLTEHEKDVFKTFAEISPKEIILQAAQRQKYVCQSQSLNLIIDPAVPVKDVNALYIEAWKLGVKSLYYQINENAAQQLSRSILTCSSCEG
jgi:ribonucleoside-diphosphate reductase alpha chain